MRVKILVVFIFVEMFIDSFFDSCWGSLIGCELFIIFVFVFDILIIYFI